MIETERPGFGRATAMLLKGHLSPKATPAWSQVIMLAALAGRMLLSIGLTVLLGRCLSPQEFGFFALVATMFGLAHELTDMGSGNVAVRGAARAGGDERAMLENLLGWRLALSLVAATACAVLALVQPSLPQTLLLLGTAAILSFSYLSGFGVVFQLRQAQMAPSVLSVLVQAGTLAASGAMVALHAPGAWFAAVLLAREAASMAGVRALATRLLGYAPGPRYRRAALRPFAGRALIVAAGTLFYHAQFQSGPIFVQALRPAAELGAFAAALRPLVPLLFVPWVLMLPLVPLLSRLAASDRAAFRRQAKGALDLSFGIGAVIAAVTAQLAPAVLQVLYGPAFSAGPLSAVDSLRWLALPLGCSYAAAALSTVMLADHREWQVLQISAGGLVIYAAANLVLLPVYGFAGSAMATALAICALTAAGLLLMRQGADGIAPDGRTMLLLAPAAVVFGLLHAMGGPALLQIAVGGVLAGAALLIVWIWPGLAACRAEQAALTSGLRPADA